LTEYIDWTFFFTAWDLRGKYPAILEHPRHGKAARELFDHGRQMLDRLVREKRLEARGVYGFWPARSQRDDIVLYDDEQRRAEIGRLRCLRQQSQNRDSGPSLCLADFVSPKRDFVGAFAVTAGIGVDALVAEFEAKHDDYSAILVKALADRLAEAFAEMLHARARRDWGYGRGENLTRDELIAEKYRGIRPALGYPACPDHTEKQELFALLDAPSLGMSLTSSFAMVPAASVSGFYLAHPKARYFSVGRVGRDQVEDYAMRKGMDVADVERWLAPNLGYDPE
jgi:5-methyltetrahydrofolate--homocysteine methyltransferase